MHGTNFKMSKTFGPKWDDVTEEWRKLHNAELNDLYSLLNFIPFISSRIMKERDHLEDPDVEVRIILEWI
jgi:hypothetical protein